MVAQLKSDVHPGRSRCNTVCPINSVSPEAVAPGVHPGRSRRNTVCPINSVSPEAVAPGYVWT